jgi:predicted SpoU family rRNA methylase
VRLKAVISRKGGSKLPKVTSRVKLRKEVEDSHSNKGAVCHVTVHPLKVDRSSRHEMKCSCRNH